MSGNSISPILIRKIKGREISMKDETFKVTTVTELFHACEEVGLDPDHVKIVVVDQSRFDNLQISLPAEATLANELFSAVNDISHQLKVTNYSKLNMEG